MKQRLTSCTFQCTLQCHAGFSSMLSLVANRLKAGDLKQAVSDMATVLQLMESDSLAAV
jgi:hypothetical protein